MKVFIKLLRAKHWVKNLYLFIPIFFSGDLFNAALLLQLFFGFLSFSLVASSIYILNDIKDRKMDQLHPNKRLRPIASGRITITAAVFIGALIFVIGSVIAGFLNLKFLFILMIYFILNMAYSLGLKKVSIVDIVIISIGFVLRVRAGGALVGIAVSEWLVIMIFLLSLFMALAKRYDDVLLEKKTGEKMRVVISMYNESFLNITLAMVSGIIIVSYIMYTMDVKVVLQFGTHRLYYTSLFVIVGVLRYMQLIYLKRDSGSPTKILLSDRFIQFCIFLWIIGFYAIIYLPDFSIF